MSKMERSKTSSKVLLSRSSGVSLYRAWQLARKLRRLAWLIGMHLGLPVVPEVNIR